MLRAGDLRFRDVEFGVQDSRKLRGVEIGKCLI